MRGGSGVNDEVASSQPETWFYHLHYRSVAQAAATLLEKALARGWRAMVASTQSARIEALDEALWTYDEASFLPHGRADRPFAERQPVVLTTSSANVNAAQMALLLDAADGVEDLHIRRTVIMFEADDDIATKSARARWKSLRAIGAPVSYWKEGKSGSWEKLA